MERKIKWILLLSIIHMIDHTFSAVFIPFELRMPEDDYTNTRSASVHRGLLLSYSLPKKILMCRDLLSAFVDEAFISDGLILQDDPQHSLTVGTIESFMADRSLQNEMEDIFFLCSGKNLTPKYTYNIEYFLSSAFRPGLMYSGSAVFKFENKMQTMLKFYTGMSPEYEFLEQTKLEKQYVTSRQMIRALRDESPEYVKMIDERDSISELSLWQKYLLCSSIILSPNYEKGRRELFLPWFKYKESAQKNIHLYRRKCLTFVNNEYEKDGWCADCLYCKSPFKEIDGSPARSINLILTRAYDDKYSLYVLREQNENIFLKEYIKNSPILMNTRVPFTNDARIIQPVDYE